MAHSKEVTELKSAMDKLTKSQFLTDYSKQIIEEIHLFEQEQVAKQSYLHNELFEKDE